MTVTQPVGTFQATLTSVHLIRRRESKGWGLMLRGRTKSLDREVSQWIGLSTDPDDPFSPLSTAVDRLHRLAARLGLPSSLPPEETLTELQGLVGGDVLARVYPTPVGARATFSRSEAW